MAIFAHIRDPLVQRLDGSFVEIFQSIQKLRQLLDLDSYDDMGGDLAHRDELLAVERKLARKLTHPIAESFPPKGQTRRDVIIAFLSAYRLAELYPDTVGSPNRVRTSIPLKTFPLFRVYRPARARRKQAFRALCERFRVHAEDRKQIEKQYAQAKEKIREKTNLVRILQGTLEAEHERGLSRDSIDRLFGRLFPGHPLRPGEVDLVCTDTGLYFCILSEKAFKKTQAYRERDAAAKKALRAFLKAISRFKFERFTHFPMFSFFDARDAEPAFIETLIRQTGLEQSALLELLSAVVTVEQTDVLEKYLIHDTWGHIWQADLTGLKVLYDHMASLQYPLSPDAKVVIDGNVVSFTDLLYLTAGGEIAFDEGLADKYIEGLITERVDALLSPICAELCADVIEYNFLADHPGAAAQLPSSSLFAHNPAKVDFAWLDLKYYVNTLKKANRIYEKDAALKRNFVERLRHLLKLKYDRNYRALRSRGDLSAALLEVFDAFLARYESLLARHLDTKLDLGGTSAAPRINAFFRLFTNLLRIQFTLNRLFKDSLEGPHQHLRPHRMVLIIFLIKYFETDPLKNFWDLDETLSAYALPCLKAIHRAESELATGVGQAAGVRSTK